MRVLVTGGAGYIGSAVVEELRSRGHVPIVYDNLTYHSYYPAAGASFVYGDIRDTPRLSALAAECDATIWLAAIVGDAACQVDPHATLAINYHALEHHLAAHPYTHQRLVFASSCSVYGYQDGLLNEASPCDPLSEYARLKLAAEPLMHNHDAVILRFGTAFGAPLGFCRPRLDLAINRMAVRGAARGVIDVCGGEQWRPWASIRDLAYAVCQALNYRIPPGTYNIASENATLGDAAARIAETLEPLHIVLDERPADDPRNYHVDTSAAKLLGLILPEPLCTIEDAARELALLVLSGRIPDWRDALFVNAAWLKQRGTPCRLNV